MTTRQHQLRTARGKRYGDLYKDFYSSEIGQSLFADAADLAAAKNSLDYSDIGMLMLRYDLPCVTTFKLLEDAGILPCGTWQRCQERKLKATQVRKAGVIRSAAAICLLLEGLV